MLSFMSAGLYADDITLDWTSSGHNPVGQFYVSPYIATVKETGKALTLYCIDFNHEVAPPYEWKATLNPLDYGDVPDLQYGSADVGSQDAVWTDYKMAAWLIDQLIHVNPLDATELHQQAVFQYAAWEIFLKGSTNVAKFNASVASAGGASFQSEINTAFANAQTAVARGYAPSGWEVVTPDPHGSDGSTQEFLTIAPVPETSSVVLLVTVIGGLALARWRRSTGRQARAGQ